MSPADIYWHRIEEDPAIDCVKPSIETDWGVPSAPGRPAAPPARIMPHYTPAGRPVAEHTITEAKIRSDWGVGDIVRSHMQQRGAGSQALCEASWKLHVSHAAFVSMDWPSAGLGMQHSSAPVAGPDWRLLRLSACPAQKRMPPKEAYWRRQEMDPDIDIKPCIPADWVIPPSTRQAGLLQRTCLFCAVSAHPPHDSHLWPGSEPGTAACTLLADCRQACTSCCSSLRQATAGARG